MTLRIKRVVTGVDANGTSICYEDEPLPAVELAIMPGVEIFQVWGTEGPLMSPATDPGADNPTFFPGHGGSRFGLFRFPPDSGSRPEQPTPQAAALKGLVAEAESKAPGLVGVFEPDAPGMHQTATVDYSIVVEGELSLELDNGIEVQLPSGSCVVQNGARHRWRNKGTAPATLAYVILAADTPG